MRLKNKCADGECITGKCLNGKCFAYRSQKTNSFPGKCLHFINIDYEEENMYTSHYDIKMQSTYWENKLGEKIYISNEIGQN